MVSTLSCQKRFMSLTASVRSDFQESGGYGEAFWAIRQRPTKDRIPQVRKLFSMILEFSSRTYAQEIHG